MERQDGEVHVETDDARGGSTPNIVRWILLVSLLLAIVLLSITWITGALSVGPQTSDATASGRAADQSDSNSDVVLSDDAAQIDAVPQSGPVQPGMVENEASKSKN